MILADAVVNIQANILHFDFLLAYVIAACVSEKKTTGNGTIKIYILPECR